MLNSLKISDKKLIFFYIRNPWSILFLKKKKLENLKKFSRISNIARFFFKCNSEFYNYKYQLLNIRFFFFLKKLTNFIEDRVFFVKFSKNLLATQVLIDFSKFLSRKNILSFQLEKNFFFLIILKHLKWFFTSPISNIFLFAPFLNTQFLNFFTPNQLANFYFRLILTRYYDVLFFNKLQSLILKKFFFELVYLYKYHINYIFL